MPATTIKIDSDLLEKVQVLKPKRESVSAYVRGLIEREHRDRALREAARTYEAFLREHPSEREAMEVWESAPLSDAIEPNKP